MACYNIIYILGNLPDAKYASMQLLKDAQAAELCGNLDSATKLYAKYYSQRPFSYSYTPLLTTKERSMFLVYQLSFHAIIPKNTLNNA